MFIPNEKVNDFIIITESKKYIIDMLELVHHRNGLNEVGWKLLPKNYSYIDDKGIVRDLVDRGGLYHSFTKNWIN